MADNDSGNPATQGDQTINGTGADDQLSGAFGNDTINGGDGDDVLRGDGPIEGTWHFETFDRNFSSADGQAFDFGADPGERTGSGYVTDFNESELTNSVRGTSGNPSDFGVIYTSTLNIAANGVYTFATTSDDGSTIEIFDSAGNQVPFTSGSVSNGYLNNDFHQSPTTRSAQITLDSSETYTIQVRYWENAGGDELAVTVNPPGPGGAVNINDSGLVGVPPGPDFSTTGVPAGAEGDDLIDGGTGNDDIQGNGGNDTLLGGAGFDTVSGGEGNDSITDTGDGGTFSGDAGDDTINVTGAVTTVTVSGGTGDDAVTVFNAVGSSNTINLDEGNDTFTGGDAADTVFGGEGDDSITSGAGDDVLDGGDGDDTFNLFTGNDVITGGLGNDIFTEGASEGSDTITDFNVGNTGSLDDGDQTNNDFVDLSSFYSATTLAAVNAADADPSNDFGNALAMMRADAADGVLDGVIGSIDYSSQIGGVDLTLQDGSGGTVTGTDLTFDNTNVICFGKGTLIKTETGHQKIEQIKVGDRVVTRHNGLQPVRWIGRRTLGPEVLAAHPNLRPIRIKANALAEGIPARDLIVSPQHRIVVRSKIAIRMFDTDEVFVIAKHLLGTKGVSVATGLRQVTYLHLMCDNHEVIEADGAFAETLHTGQQALKAMSPAALEELKLIFGDRLPHHRPLALFVPTGKRAKQLVARHVKNNRDMYSDRLS